ncbi:MAG: RsmB/NOP family class I SAM-dependent RNA methyltransferase [Candidatus Heimdallarchaeota archaeon]|nr:RsmB/NOP family class I SAM-dependent RNA methyltransferase [Candidatus Heimdallarchaeota archaeon]MCK5048492.1 RsmB/NOP family class I SAM-dependent RNA methyltransferase [Candidatus Heimdallarchaeota archaeon]
MSGNQLNNIPNVITAKIIHQVLYDKTSMREAIKQSVQASPEVIKLIYSLAFETIRRKNLIDQLFHKAIPHQSTEKVEPLTMNLIRIATYRLKFLEEKERIVLSDIKNELEIDQNNLESFSAVEEAVHLINDITIEEALSSFKDQLIREAHFNFMPTWIFRKLIDQFGDEEGRKLVKALNSPLPTYLRINQFKASDNEIRELLEKYQNEYKIDEHIPHLFSFEGEGEKPLPLIEGFREKFTIQGKTSALVPYVLDPQKNEIILDMCAAPGGKTALISEIMNNSGTIVANELNERRAAFLGPRFEKLGISNVIVRVGDGLKIQEDEYGLFDRISLDPPCTGSGTFQSRPDTKWRIDKYSITRLSDLQKNLLAKAGELVKPGGVIVYSTCSLFKEENEEVIASFLSNHPQFILENIAIDFGLPIAQFDGKNRYFLPHTTKTEGFFITKIRKNY